MYENFLQNGRSVPESCFCNFCRNIDIEISRNYTSSYKIPNEIMNGCPLTYNHGDSHRPP